MGEACAWEIPSLIFGSCQRSGIYSRARLDKYARCKKHGVTSNLGLAEWPQHAPTPELQIESSDRGWAMRVISSH